MKMKEKNNEIKKDITKVLEELKRDFAILKDDKMVRIIEILESKPWIHEAMSKIGLVYLLMEANTGIISKEELEEKLKKAEDPKEFLSEISPKLFPGNLILKAMEAKDIKEKYEKLKEEYEMAKNMIIMLYGKADTLEGLIKMMLNSRKE